MLVRFEKDLENKRVVLGSQSPRRKELLGGIFKKFEIIPSQFDESTIKPEDYPNPSDFVQVQSRKKCEELYSRVSDADIVITADTIVTIDGLILGKPGTNEKAYEMISMLSGRGHEVMTGVYIAFPKLNKFVSFVERTVVYFAKLPEEAILSYANSKDPLDKAGAYGIQSGAMSLIEKIEGDYFNVVGLPVHRLSVEIYKVLSDN